MARCHPMTELLTTAEAAERLAVSQQTLRRWIRDGSLRSVRLPSGQHRVTSAEIDRIISADPEGVTS